MGGILMDEFRRRLMMIQAADEGLDIEIPTIVGVYILGTDNKFYKRNKWNKTNDKAVGVAVIDPKSNFVIAPSVLDSKYGWSGQQILVQGIATTSDENKALNDYAGYNNTQKIIEQDSQANTAIGCRKYIFKNGLIGYLPALGELNLITKYLRVINDCLLDIGSKAIGVDYNNDVYWSSTQEDFNSAWRMYLNDGFAARDLKEELSFVLPVAKLQSNI